MPATRQQAVFVFAHGAGGTRPRSESKVSVCARVWVGEWVGVSVCGGGCVHLHSYV